MSWKQFAKFVIDALATRTPAPPEPPPAKPRATIAFVVVDDSNTPIPTAFATFEDGASKQANDDGYIAFERELGIYNVTFEADDFKTTTKRFQLEGNRQFTVKLASAKPAPAPVPPPAPVPTPAPVPAPPPAPAAPVTDEEFKAAFFAILKKHNAPRACNLQTLYDTRADVEAIGCEWQHDSSGVLRPRLFLPVPIGADPYSRPYDVGLYGEPWTWIKR